MNAKRHADLARQLIDRNGGFEAAALVCRLKKSRLQKCCSVGAGAYLPIDVIVELERACGEQVYTRAILEDWDAPVTPADLLTEACEASEGLAHAQKVIREAVSDDGKIDAAEDRAIEAAIADGERRIRDLRSAKDRVAA